MPPCRQEIPGIERTGANGSTAQLPGIRKAVSNDLLTVRVRLAGQPPQRVDVGELDCDYEPLYKPASER